MKRPGLLSSLLLIAFMTALLGCSQNGAPGGEGTTSQSSVPAIEGSTFDAPGFTIIVPKDWESTSFDGGVRMYKGTNDIIEVSVRGYNMTAGEDKSQSEGFAQRYNGTKPEQVDFAGMKFWKTTFTAGSVYQTSYMSMKNGQLVAVKIAGPDHETNQTMSGILSTLKFR